eukprot:1441698-Rhodomonas_salina.2
MTRAARRAPLRTVENRGARGSSTARALATQRHTSGAVARTSMLGPASRLSSCEPSFETAHQLHPASTSFHGSFNRTQPPSPYNLSQDSVLFDCAV